MKRTAAVVFGLILMASGCGGSADSNPLATIVLAADRTQDAGTARMWMDMTMDGPDGLVTATSDGAFDMDAGEGHMTMDMDMPDAPAGTPDLGTTEAVYTGTTIYMKMPTLSAHLPPGKPWVSLDLQAAGEEVGLDLGALMQSGTSDPTQTLQYLRGASGDVTVVGEETVRGADATHYRATISLDKIVEEAPDDLRQRLEPTIELLKEWAGTDELPVDVWIDDQGRMVRQTQSFTYAAGPAAGMSMDMTLEMYDFGTDVDVELPPPSEVTDLVELMQRSP